MSNEKEKGSNKTPSSIADMESNTSNGAMGEEEITPFNTQVDVFIHTKRKRLIDPDGLSSKAAIDGLVHCGLLEDDTAKHIRKVEAWSQEKTEKGEEEETVITLTEV